MSKYTSRQIAAAANVSPATVSRVLNGTAQVSSELHDRVMAAAQQLGYKEPVKADPRTHLIGLLTPKLSNPFYMEIIEGILDTAAAAGYNVMLCPTVSSNLQEFEDIALKQDQLDPVAGLITLCRLRPNSLVLRTLPDDIPIVQCCEYDESLPYPIVAIDNYAAAFHATTYLLGLGYTKLAIFNSSCHTLYGKKREQGFRDALAAKGITPREDWMLHLGAIDYNLALAATRNLFSQSDHPEAIFTVSDVYAAGITKALAQMGIRVPEDVSVVGFDDTEIALINTPSLTTVQQPRHKLGMTACNVLLRLIRTGSCTSPYFMVESDLIVRDSTCAKLTL